MSVTVLNLGGALFSGNSVDSHNTIVPSVLLGVLFGMAYGPIQQSWPIGLIKPCLSLDGIGLDWMDSTSP